MSTVKEYKINIHPKILELLGPSLYTNVYYVLAELVANAYDAMASNVYIIQTENSIIVEDDGSGMSYEEGDIERYLNVAIETRSSSDEALTANKERKRMGRKGIGKLAALSVSENVNIMTKKGGDVSGFILSRHVGEDHELKALNESEIEFQKLQENEDGTSVVMINPEYGLHKTGQAIKRNLLKIFPLVNSQFKIHVITGDENIIIDSFDKEIVKDLGGLIILGREYEYLSEYFDSGLIDKKVDAEKDLLEKRGEEVISLKLKDKKGKEKDYNLEIKGWIGAYKSTKGRKNDTSDFPDNFISLLSNGKLGEYSILPVVGKNRLQEVFVVGQLHVNLFEESDLPDMALSNRQGYKTEDERYKSVISYVSETLLPEIIEKRVIYASYNKDEKEKSKLDQQKKDEENLRNKVNEYKNLTSDKVVKKIEKELKGKLPVGSKEMIEQEMNDMLPIVGIKRKVDTQKKKILISHTKKDKPLADVIYKMLSFNNLSDDIIIYTNSENEECRIPNGLDIFGYLREFFVDSFSDKKIFVIYVTSEDMAKSWGAVSEVGAGWITKSKHDIFNVNGHTPQSPLNISAEWHTSSVDNDKIKMDAVNFDKFVVKILDICTYLGYIPKDKDKNKIELNKHISII